MNFVLISPYFPENFTYFSRALNNKNVNTLGIGDQPYDHLSESLKSALTEYYKVDNMEDYDQVYRACGYFAHKYGRIDRIESNNEYWLETDARLRTDFNITGFKSSDMVHVKYKSKMKHIFREAGIKVAPGIVIRSPKDGLDFVKEHGYPVVVKPDNGVGAAGTFKLKNDNDLENFLKQQLDTEYFMETFVKGEIVTYDGLTDQNGEIVFVSSMVFATGIMDIVNEDLDMSYYIPRILPQNIVEAGEKAVKAFGLKERFFHVEFFLTPEKEVYALEINVRPPGGLTVEMFNYANDIDIFDLYANVVTENVFNAEIKRPYNCFYAGRKNGFKYKYTPDEIANFYPDQVVYHTPVASVFSAAIGNYGFVIRTPEFKEGFDIAKRALEKQ